MSDRIHAHLRSNIVGYIALFCFAMSGTALATHPGGNNTIDTGDIINGQVLTADLAADSVNGGKLRNDSTASRHVVDNTLTAADIANTDSLGSPEIGNLGGGDITDGSLNGDDVADGGLTGADIADDSITPADTTGLVGSSTVLWAVVNADGTVVRSSNGVATGVLEATGDYEIAFGGGNLDPCASMAQISRSFYTDGAPGPGEAASNQGEFSENDIDVRTFNSAGAAADSPFTVHVLCGGAAGARSSR